MNHVDVRRLTSIALLGVVLLAAPSARAQITGPSVNTTGASCSGGGSTDGDCRNSVQTLTNNGTTLATRYAWNINADVIILTTHDTSGNARHNVAFNATAPGAYRLDINTSRVGAMGRNADASNCDGSADTSGVTGSSNIALNSGGLSLVDPGSIGNGGSTTDVAYGPGGQTSAATIFRTSNGVAQNHSLSFTWNGSVRSNSCEASVRQGESSGTTSGCSVCGYPGTPSRTQSSDGHFVTVTFTSLCGNGTIDGAQGEQCDVGSANGTFGTCCSTSCQFRSGATACRNSTGPCDPAENCTGSNANCPADLLSPSSTVCRPAGGVCDIAENCTGSGAGCPFDFKAGILTTCRPSGGVCDIAETCDGTNNACPADAKSTAQCRAAGGICGVAEVCNGVSNNCPADVHQPSTTVCRGSAGVCDVAENCTGSSPTCPANTFAPTSTTCRPSGGICDVAESCTGSGASCPADAFEPSSVECRASAGVCDSAENCTGNTAACPIDSVQGAFVECRPSAGVCDAAENCDGVNTACPADAVAPSTTVCRGSAGACDVAENCDGVNTVCPADAVQPSSFTCRSSAGICDIAENCDGSSTACPADGFEPSSTECRASAGVCDNAENCTGSGASCPADAFQPSSTTCRPSAGVCDIAENCSGSSAGCPSDSVAGAFVECRAASGVCDTAENCDGLNTACPADAVALIGTICRSGVDICDAVEVCDGTNKTCPTDLAAPNGTPCNDNNVCSSPDTCQAGVCTGIPDAGSCADHYLCYKTKASGYTPVNNINLVDQFETINVNATKVRTLCTPADKNGEGIADSQTHLQSFMIRPVSGTPSFVRRTNLKIDNQLGTLRVDAYKRDLLLVPTNKNLSGPTTPPDNNLILVDHYKCYKAKVTPGTPKFVSTTVQIADQFQSPAKSVVLKKVKHLCTPVNKNAEGIKNADAHLLCYQAKTAKGAPKHVKRTGVNTANQLDSSVIVGTSKESEFCIPSLKTITP